MTEHDILMICFDLLGWERSVFDTKDEIVKLEKELYNTESDIRYSSLSPDRLEEEEKKLSEYENSFQLGVEKIIENIPTSRRVIIKSHGGSAMFRVLWTGKELELEQFVDHKWEFMFSYKMGEL